MNPVFIFHFYCEFSFIKSWILNYFNSVFQYIYQYRTSSVPWVLSRVTRICTATCPGIWALHIPYAKLIALGREGGGYGNGDGTAAWGDLGVGVFGGMAVQDSRDRVDRCEGGKVGWPGWPGWKYLLFVVKVSDHGRIYDGGGGGGWRVDTRKLPSYSEPKIPRDQGHQWVIHACLGRVPRPHGNLPSGVMRPDMVYSLANPEGIQHKEEISVEMVTPSLEDMTIHFLLRRKSWAQYGRTWCMIRQVGEEMSRA